MRVGDIAKIVAAAGIATAVGCKDGGPAATGGGTGGCHGGKCDDPGTASGTGTGTSTGTGGGSGSGTDTDGLDPAEVDALCQARRADAFNPDHFAFEKNLLRWSCADVDGTAPDERGQEYCEYFAIVQLPDPVTGVPGDPSVLGVNLGPDLSDGQTPFGLDLSDAEIAALEADPQAVVGTCIFSSWNADIDDPTCTTKPCTASRDVMGVPLSADTFRMKFDPNTNQAAQQLVQDCMDYLPRQGNPDDASDPLNDAFYRGCWLDADINQSEHRKSDDIICSASMRLVECGCGLPDGAKLPAGLAPADVLGFRLGTWDDDQGLPPGCVYEDLVDGSHTIVRCDLTATEVVQNAAELKAYCEQQFAGNVVVHVDVPADLVTCMPPADEVYAYSCTATPWVLQP